VLRLYSLPLVQCGNFHSRVVRRSSGGSSAPLRPYPRRFMSFCHSASCSEEAPLGGRPPFGFLFGLRSLVMYMGVSWDERASATANIVDMLKPFGPNSTV